MRKLYVLTALTISLATASQAEPLVVPFDFSRSAIVLDVSVRGTPLHMFLDTGASPSAIDTAHAKALGLKIDYADGGEASGDGGDAHAMVYPTSLDDLAVGGRRFGPIEALAADMTLINRAYGRPIEGTLRLSFLRGKVMLLDYPARTLTIFDAGAQVDTQRAKCRKVWGARLKSYPGDTIPIVELGIGRACLPVSVDTGSNGGVELYKKALEEPEVKAALVEMGSTTETGNRGAYTAKIYKLNTPVRLGPFVLPAGQTVTLSGNSGSRETRLANVGNKLVASMRLKLLLDYRKNRIAFLGDCAP